MVVFGILYRSGLDYILIDDVILSSEETLI
jgi:hypothetical protein